MLGHSKKNTVVEHVANEHRGTDDLGAWIDAVACGTQRPAAFLLRNYQ